MQSSRGLSAFIDLLSHGLEGGAADILGYITAASLYAHIDQTMGRMVQRPLFKASIEDFTMIRRVSATVTLTQLRKLPEYFPEQNSEYPLHPSMEPPEDRGTFADAYASIAYDPEAEKVLRDLQALRAADLLALDGEDHMWHATMKSKPCRLTGSGQHYWRLAKLGRLG